MNKIVLNTCLTALLDKKRKDSADLLWSIKHNSKDGIFNEIISDYESSISGCSSAISSICSQLRFLEVSE